MQYVCNMQSCSCYQHVFKQTRSQSFAVVKIAKFFITQVRPNKLRGIERIRKGEIVFSFLLFSLQLKNKGSA